MTKKLGVTLLALCCALGLCAVTALAANGNNAPATPTVEPQAPVSLAHFRQSGADVQQSIDNGKSWEIYSPVEEPDYFTYNEFSEWLETEMAHIQELVEAG